MGFYLTIFILGFLAISLWSFYIVVRPPKIILNRNPANFNLPAKEIDLTTTDGVNLSSWFVEGNKEKVVMFLHGYPAEKSDMLFIASSLYPDFSLLLVDLRYFGKSEGKYTTLGIKEQLDVKAGLDFLESKGFKNIGILGFSLGGATALNTAEKDKRINAIVSYASFADLRTLGYQTYWTLPGLKYPLVELMLLWSKALFSESAIKTSPLNAAPNINIPVMLVHSKEDEQISFKHAEKLKDAFQKNPKAQFYFLETGLHGELPVDFNIRIKEFFKQSL